MRKKSFINPSISKIYTLSALQKGILYQNISNADSNSYIIHNLFNLKGIVDIERLESSFRMVVQRYDSLRTSIMYKKVKSPIQVVLKKRELKILHYDLTSLDAEMQKRKLNEICQYDLNQGFDLQKDVLIRLTILHCPNDQYKILLSYHHIILDGWSIGIVLNKWKQYYNSLASQTEQEIYDAILLERNQDSEYEDYINWLEEKDKKAGIQFWRDKLRGYEGVTEIKPARQEKLEQTDVKRVKHDFSEQITEKLSEMARTKHVTVNSVIETAWGIVLGQFCDKKDVVYGKVVSGRNTGNLNVESTVGLFIQTIPKRIQWEENTSTWDLIEDVYASDISELNYSYCGLAEIQSLTEQKSDLIRTLFVYENYYLDDSIMKNIDESIYFEPVHSREKTDYAISAMASMSDQKLSFSIIYEPSLFSEYEVKGILEHLEVILQQILLEEEVPVTQLKRITGSEEHLIMNQFNNTDLEYNKEETIVDAFEQIAKEMPCKAAVVLGDKTVTYEELNSMANRLARKLRAMGVKPNTLVGILAEKSIEMVVAIFGVLKSGAGYVPIDPEYPLERIRYIVDDSHPKILIGNENKIRTQIPFLTMSELAKDFSHVDNLEHVSKAEDLAYCIYTSGTTGRPKGVLIEHIGVLNLRKYFMEFQSITPDDKVLQFASFAFDATVSELTMSLLTGACLYLMPKEIQQTPFLFEEFIKEKEISIAILPPQFLNQVDIKGLRTIISAGSATNPTIVRHNNKVQIYSNDYGPTEVTVCATFWKHKNNEFVPGQIPIGRPICNKKIYILNNGKLCGIGIPGEICVGGVGLARGYLNRPELTSERFIINPFDEGRLYKTGDRGAWTKDGNILFFGRIDQQVKIRGYRIEIQEIESNLRKIEEIKDAFVTTFLDKTNEYQIVAYVVSDRQQNMENVKKRLSDWIPNYMIPSYIMQVDEIKVNVNGKPDVSQMPKPDISYYRKENEYVMAGTDTERVITNIWRDVLKQEQIGIHDVFFDIGGNSILVISLLSQINSKYQGVVKVGDIFAHPTIHQLASFIDEASQKELESMNTVFPVEYFSSQTKGGRREFAYEEQGELFSKAKELMQESDIKYYSAMLFIYGYLIASVTNEQEVPICLGIKDSYVSFPFLVNLSQDLNELQKQMQTEIENRERYQNPKIHFKKRTNGLQIMLMLDCENDQLYQTYSDIGIKVSLNEDGIYFKMQLLDKRANGEKMEALFHDFINVIKSVFQSS